MAQTNKWQHASEHQNITDTNAIIYRMRGRLLLGRRGRLASVEGVFNSGQPRVTNINVNVVIGKLSRTTGSSSSAPVLLLPALLAVLAVLLANPLASSQASSTVTPATRNRMLHTSSHRETTHAHQHDNDVFDHAQAATPWVDSHLQSYSKATRSTHHQHVQALAS